MPRLSNLMNGRALLSGVVVLLISMGSVKLSRADLVTIINPGFEDISGEAEFNEFTFGPLNGWDLYDPGGITDGGDGPTYFIGTLRPTPPTFFIQGAPEGERVGIAFNFFGSGDAGEYGFVQTLSETLQANQDYELTVEIGNIASGTAENNDFFNLDGFPGYRVDLLAGGVVIAQDDNSLAGTIPEGEFATSTVRFQTGSSHALLGQSLGIRLVNLNQVDPDFPAADLEVDFDNVRLNATPSVPEPAGLIWIAALTMVAGLACKSTRDRIRRANSEEYRG